MAPVPLDQVKAVDLACMDEVGSPRPERRLAYLDGARAVAALLVVINHCWLTIFAVEYNRHPAGVLAVLTDWMLYGHFAVPAFLVVSGFSLALVPARDGWKLKAGSVDFIRRRFIRIVPPYLAALALSVLMGLTLVSVKTGTHWDIVLPVSLKGVVVHLFLLQDVVQSRAPNHVFWSIAIEWHVYFLFPALLLAWRRYGPAVTLALTTAVTLVAQVFVFIQDDYDAFPSYLAIFGLGVWTCGRVLAGRQRSWKLPLAVSAVLMAVLITIVYALPTLKTLKLAGFIDLVPAGVAAALLLSAGAGGPVRRVLEHRWLTKIGIFSYSLYLVHAPLVQLYWQVVVRPLRVSDGWALLLMAGAVPFSLMAAWLFYRGVESRFVGRRRPVKVGALT